jgi:hypothetical protein
MGNVRWYFAKAEARLTGKQGAKAASKRDRKDDKAKPAKSQLKVNEKAMDIQCQICKSTFLKTTRAPAYVASAPLSFTRIPYKRTMLTRSQSYRACDEQAQQGAQRLLPKFRRRINSSLTDRYPESEMMDFVHEFGAT